MSRSGKQMQVVSSGSIGFTGLLTILFVALKLTGQIGWSWWWVLSPLWITALVGLSFFMLLVVVAISINR